MSYTFKQILVSASKYSIKCPYEMTPIGFCIHNTSNNASAENEIKYMISNSNQVSYHYAVDDMNVIQGLPTNRNAWASGDGNGQGNRKHIHIEICKSTGDLETFKKCERNCVLFLAQELKKRGWGIDRVKKHQDFANKYCPHKTLDLGWKRFLDMVQAELNKLNGSQTSKVEIQKVETIDVNKKVKFVKDVNIWNDTNWKSVKGQVKKGRVVHVTKMTKDYAFYVIDGGYVSVDSQFSLCSDMNKKPLKKIMPIRDCTCFTYCDGKHGIDQLKTWEVFETIEYRNGWYLVYGRGWVHESHVKCFELNEVACTNGCI